MKRFYYIITALFTILVSGCEIKQDREDCDNAYVFFSYYGDGDRQIFPERIGKVNMFVYDGRGQIADVRTLGTEDLAGTPVVRLSLPSGYYDIVCWGNARDVTEIRNIDNMNSAKVAAKTSANPDNIHSADSLYVGRKRIRVKQDKLSRDTVEFAGAHVKMIVKMSGFADGKLPADDPVVAVRASTHASMGFGENYTGEYAVCAPGCKPVEDGELFYLSRFNSLRFEDENNITVDLYDTASGETIRSLELRDFMSANGIRITGKHEVTVGIHFVKTATAISIKPWESSEIKPGW